MKKAIVVLMILVLSIGCTAPVKMSTFPASESSNVNTKDDCKKMEGYKNIRVLSIPPEHGTYIELGTIMTEQSSTSEFVITSETKQVEEAQVQACMWGADAIIVLDSSSDKGIQYGIFSGLTHKDEKNLRFVAIKYKK